MISEWIIGALALITIGGVLALSIFHFAFAMKDPKFLEATKQVAANRQSATTQVSSEGTKGRTLRQRLDAAPRVDDRLGRGGNLSPLDAVTTNWSNVRETLRDT